MKIKELPTCAAQRHISLSQTSINSTPVSGHVCLSEGYGRWSVFYAGHGNALQKERIDKQFEKHFFDESDACEYFLKLAEQLESGELAKQQPDSLPTTTPFKSSATNNYQIRTLVPDDLIEASRLLAHTFSNYNPLHQALEFDHERYADYLHLELSALVTQNSDTDWQCLVAESSRGELQGALVAFDFNYTNALQPLAGIEPLNALLDTLSSAFRTKTRPLPGQYLLVDMVAISPQASGQGLYQMLRERVQDSARKAGYEHVLGELSSSATQHVLVNKLDHQVLSEIELSSFKYDSYRPFRNVKSPRTIQLVDHRLS